MEVIVQDANNIVIEVDQGRQGRGVEDVSLITVGADYYLLFTFTDGTTDQVGPIATTVTEVISAEVRNAEAVTILKGQPVYLFQAQGNLATVKLAYNTSDATSAKTLGLAAENIAPNAQGLVTCQGTLGGLNTSAYNEGDTLYLGATAGTLTNVKPQAPNHLVYIGVVERANAGAGQIYVRVQNGFELDEIHDVRIISPVNGNTLIYDASTSLWKNAGITAGSGISVTNGPASITVGNTGVLSFSGGTTGLTPATATTGAVSLAGTLAIANGGTGQTTANAALNALLPSQATQSGKYLKTDGTNASWDQLDISTADITGVLPTANGGTGLSSFTANGVVYASSTSALTTGSALTFTGATFANNGSTNVTSFQAVTSTNTAQLQSRPDISYSRVTSSAFLLDLATLSNQPILFTVNSNEQMRLTSTGLGIGTSSPGASLQVGNGTGLRQALISGGGYDLFLGASGGSIFGFASQAISLVFNTAAVPLGIGTNASQPLIFGTSAAERMRLDSSGNLGIGTISPAGRLHVAQTNAGGAQFLTLQTTNSTQGNAVIRWQGSGATNQAFIGSYVNSADTGNLEFGNASSTTMQLTSTGNLGLGVTPSAWGSGGNLQLAGSKIIASANSFLDIVANAYFSGSYLYTASSTASRYQQSSGQHIWYNAPSGTAGNAISFTQAMTLDASGNLGLGTTPGSWLGKAFQISTYTSFAQRTGTSDGIFSWNALVTSGTTSGSGYVYRVTGDLASSYEQNGNHRWYVAPSGTAGNAITFTQAMTLNTSSQLLVGTTTNTNSSTVTAGGTISETVSSIQYLVASQFDVGTAPNKIPLNQYLGNLAYQNASAIAGQAGFSAGTAALPSIASATDLTTGRWFPAAGVMAWSTGGVERMRLDALGNLGVGLTNPSARVHASATDATYQLGISGTTRGIRVETNATESRIVGVDQTLISSFQPISIGGLQVVIRTNGTTEAARFNSSGNLALGNVTPSAWYTNPFIDIGQYGAIGNNSGGGGGFALYANAFEDTSGTFKYKQNYSAALYRTFAGAHQWFNAPSGTAGNTISFTQAMTLDANGRLLLGTTSGTGAQMDIQSAVAGVFTALSISNSSLDPAATTRIQIAGQGGNWAIDNTRVGAQLLFIRGTTEAARFTTANNQVLYQPAESAQNTSVTLTAANLQARIITSNAAVTLTLPTGTSLEGYTSNMATDTAFECTFIATTANAITIAANGNTTVGSLTVAGNTSGTFRFRKTAANTFTVYRVA